MTAAQGRANRNRGNRAEVAVVSWCRVSGWPSARRYLAGDGHQPGDIDLDADLVIEVKDVAQSAWPSWIGDACRQAAPSRPWIVVRRTRGTPDVGQWVACSDLIGFDPDQVDLLWGGCRIIMEGPARPDRWLANTDVMAWSRPKTTTVFFARFARLMAHAPQR